MLDDQRVRTKTMRQSADTIAMNNIPYNLYLGIQVPPEKIQIAPKLYPKCIQSRNLDP